MTQATDQRPPTQGTAEWLRDRLGKVTGSCFDRLLTPPRSKLAKEAGELGGTAKDYLYELVAETLWVQHPHCEIPPPSVPDRLRCLWGPPSVPASLPMQWGTFWEDEALDVYGHYFGVEIERPGFIVHPNHPLVGCSPDGLIEDLHVAEVKCLGMQRHARILCTGEMPSDYEAQVQGALWVTGRDFARFISFDPRLKLLHRPNDQDVLLALAVVKVPRDEEFIGRLSEAVERFLEYYHAALDSLGLQPPDSKE